MSQRPSQYVISRFHVEPRVSRAMTIAAIFFGCLARSPGAESAPDPLIVAPTPLAAVAPVSPAPAINDERILGVIPNYQTVNDPGAGVTPLTPKQKWSLALKETVDPFNVANAF